VIVNNNTFNITASTGCKVGRHPKPERNGDLTSSGREEPGRIWSGTGRKNWNNGWRQGQLADREVSDQSLRLDSNHHVFLNA
jgi:hypothetical protein